MDIKYPREWSELIFKFYQYFTVNPAFKVGMIFEEVKNLKLPVLC